MEAIIAYDSIWKLVYYYCYCCQHEVLSFTALPGGRCEWNLLLGSLPSTVGFLSYLLTLLFTITTSSSLTALEYAHGLVIASLLDLLFLFVFVHCLSMSLFLFFLMYYASFSKHLPCNMLAISVCCHCSAKKKNILWQDEKSKKKKERAVGSHWIKNLYFFSHKWWL